MKKIYMFFSLLIVTVLLCLMGMFFYSIFTNWDFVFNSLIENTGILGSVFLAMLTYFLNERSKRREREQQERDKQKKDAMQVYQNYLNNHFYIMRDKDFSPTNQHVLESRRILQSQLPLFVPDSVLEQLSLMQEKARKLYYHQMKSEGGLFEDLEKDTLTSMNKLIELMRKDLLPDTKITDKDIENLLSTSYEFLQFVREQENKKSAVKHGKGGK